MLLRFHGVRGPLQIPAEDLPECIQNEMIKWLNSWCIINLHNGSSYRGILKAIDEEGNILLAEAEGKQVDSPSTIEKQPENGFISSKVATEQRMGSSVFLGPICIQRSDIAVILCQLP
jgi:small nuclear ribonucleoprotein (snRNP)-like protein